MRRSALLLCATALALLGVVATMRAVAPAPSPPPTATISIEDLHRQIDIKSLPKMQIENLY